ncbi:MAG: hypothetical protein ACR2O0_06285 [Rhizobiaceae bacterium]
MNKRKTFGRAWINDALVTIARTITFIAVLALGLSGGIYSHAEEVSHHHAVETHHSHDHSIDLGSCCESDFSESVHCGANLLTLVELYQLHHPARVVDSTPFDIQEFIGSSLVIDPPPPRFFLV